MSDARWLSNTALMAVASYADLAEGDTSAGDNRASLLNNNTAGMSSSQLEALAKLYPTILTQYRDDPATSFCATVFKDTSGNLTLAIRGTAELGGDPNDLFPTDFDIGTSGAGYDQIVAMVNWWNRVSARRDEMVPQFWLASYSPDAVPADAVVIRSNALSVFVLDSAPRLAGTGELVDILAADPDHRIDVTGHSLGAHLAMAFSTIFRSVTGQVTVFNAPGFRNSAVNQAFFARLGGSIPTADSIINVAADESLVDGRPFNLVSGLYSRPGLQINIAIENQFGGDEPNPFLARNHSITPLADSIAVYQLLSDLDPTLGIDKYKILLNQAAQSTSASYERIIDTLQSVFGLDDKPLAAGNSHRELLYQAMNGTPDQPGLREAALYQTASTAKLLLEPSARNALMLVQHAQDATGADRLAYRFALTRLNTFVALDPNRIGLYGRFEAGGPNAGELDTYDAANNPQGLTQNYVLDRAAFLERKLYITGLDRNRNYEDPALVPFGVTPNPQDDEGRAYQREARDYEDRTSGFIASTGGNPNSLQHFIFGGTESESIEGADQEDHLYGGPGTDILIGGKGNDYLEGGPGYDIYKFELGDGKDVVLDANGRGLLLYGSKPLSVGIKQNDTLWALGSLTFTTNGPDLNIRFDASADDVTLKDFNLARAQTASYDGLRLINAPSLPLNLVRNYAGDTQINKDDTFVGTTDNESFSTDDGDDLVYADGPLSSVSTIGGDDVIEGGADRDLLFAGGGNDWVEGDSGADILLGNAGNDTLYADTSVAGTFTLDAAIAAGEHELAVGSAADFVSGDAGDDVLIDASAPDLLLGGTGNDVIVGGGGDDTIYGDDGFISAGFDWNVTRNIALGTYVARVSGAQVTRSVDIGGLDVIFGGAGDDWVFAGGGDDYVEGGAGNDVLFGEAGDDVTFGGAGDDILIGDNPGVAVNDGDDYLDGGGGNDILQGDGGSDILTGGTGDDILVGGAGKDTYIFSAGDGHDQIFDDSTGADASVLVFGAGFNPDALTIRPGSMVLDFGDAGSVELESFNHFDPNTPAAFENLVFADGTKFSFQGVLDCGFNITGTDGNDNGGDAGHPMLVGTAFKDAIHGLAGNDILAGLQGDDMIDGGAGADQLQGGDGNDMLLGGEGVDALFGMSGDDVLDGGAGRDWMLGGPGNDTYAYGAGDALYDIDGQTTVAFGPGISVSDVVLQRQPTGFRGLSVFSIALKSDLTAAEIAGVPSLEHELNVSLANDNQLAAFVFSDGTVLDHTALLRGTWVDPALFVGGGADDTLEGFAGDDSLRGGDGDDLLRGFAANDRLEGGNGTDLLDGGQGNDVLLGGAGDDTLWGGAGADTLTGGLGSDLYVYARSDGDDVISDEGDTVSADVLRFTDISPTEVALSRQASGDLVATVNDGGSVTVSGYYNALSSAIERIEFSDGAFVESSYLDTLSVAPISGTNGDDMLVGTPYEDLIQGGAGNDTLDGGAGNDLLQGGSGADTYRLRPNGGTDVILDGAGLSTIQLDGGWTFTDTDTARHGDDLVLSLENGNASLVLSGYYTGQTSWAVRTDAGEQKTIGELIDYAASVKPTTVPEWRGHYITQANQQYLTYLASFGASGGIAIDDQGFSDAPLIHRNSPFSETGSYPTFRLNIADIKAGDSGNVLDFRFSDSVIADAGGGDDFIDNGGQAFSAGTVSIGSFLYGGDGNDTIFGSWQADTLLGGSGDNYLAGSDGSDTYVVLRSDTGTTIIDEVNDYVSIGGHSAFAGGRYSSDALIFADIPYSSVSIREGQIDTTSTSSSGNGQLFRTLDFTWGTEAVVRLLVPDPRNPYIPEFPDESYGVESIRFSDGAVLPLAGILNVVNVLPTTGVPGADATDSGTEGDDFLSPSFHQKTTLLAFGGDDFVEGGSSNDVLDGGHGNDSLIESTGDDVLIGGEGDDTLRASWGNDVLNGGPGNDDLWGGPGSDVYVFEPGFGRDFIHDDTLPFRIDTDTIRFGEGIYPTDVVVTRDDNDLYLIVGSDRVDIQFVFFWGVANNPYQYTGVEGVEFFDGTVWSRDEMFARITTALPTELNDPVYGTDADETLHGLAGNDRMLALGGDDLLYGDEGDDYLEGDGGHDILIGGAGSDVIDDEATSPANFIHAGAGDDYVYIDTSRNFVIGGPGSDWVDNYAADSVIAFNRGDGQDTAWCAASFTLSLGGGIAVNDLTLEADGRDVILRTAGDDYVRLARRYESDQLYPWPEIRLQVIGDEVRMYDLLAVINHFEEQTQSQPGLILSLGSVLPSHQIQPSVGRAYAGDLAYAYAKDRLDENVSTATVLRVINDSNFGVTPQRVTNPDGPPITGADNGSVVDGTDANEQLSGGAGNDWLNGGAGNDILAGGAGNDLLTGGPGSDTYVYRAGEGTDTVFDPDGANTVVFGPGIDADAISLGVGSLFLRVGTGGIHFESFDPMNPHGPRDADRFVFADGTCLTYDELIDRGFDLYGSPGADAITGTGAVDRIRGGRGNDLLAGGAGGDTYFYDRGDGSDTIVETIDDNALDLLALGANIDVPSARAARAGDDLVLTFGTSGDSITLKGWYGVAGRGIDSVKFSDGTVWDAAVLEARVETNRAPLLANPIGNQRTDEDAAFAFTVPADTFVDPDSGDTVSYSVSLANGTALPAWIRFDAASRTFAGTPLQADVGALELLLTATDTAGLSATQPFVLTVANVNDAPNAYDDAATTDEATPVSIAASALLANDIDSDPGDTISIASASKRSTAGADVTLLVADESNGLPARVVYDPGSVFQHLAKGAQADDSFGYRIADAAGATSSARVHVAIIGANDAPVAVDDTASVQEDAAITIGGNVLANDTDVDDDAALTVTSLGTQAGRYGALTLASNGAFAYVLDNARAAVQALGAGETVLDIFGYHASDGLAASGAELVVSVLGTNDAPMLAHAISDVSITIDQPFTFALPANTFSDVDAADMLTYSAALANGTALPDWLVFDPATRSFSGKAPAGSFDVKVRAVDAAGAAVAGEFTIHAGLALIGSGRNDHFAGSAGDDYLAGGAGNDQLSGGTGDDILQGGSGNDQLVNEAGNGLLDGGSGNDALTGGTGNELFAGGAGNDVLRVAGGKNIISFNSGDGKDTVYSTGGANVFSIGGAGLDYTSLRFEKSDRDLVFKLGAGDQITLKDWYQGADKQCFVDLQVITDAMSTFDPTSSDPLRNEPVEHFDFRALVNAFDRARAATGVTTWALSNALTQFHLGGGDTEAYGGDLAYWYGRNGNFAGISVAAAQQIIGAAGFGADAQTLRPFLGLQDGFNKLS